MQFLITDIIKSASALENADAEEKAGMETSTVNFVVKLRWQSPLQ